MIIVVIIMIKIKMATFYLNMIHVTMYRELNKILTQLVHSVNATVLKSGTILIIYILQSVHLLPLWTCTYKPFRYTSTVTWDRLFKTVDKVIQWKTSVHWINVVVQKLSTGWICFILNNFVQSNLVRKKFYPVEKYDRQLKLH